MDKIKVNETPVRTARNFGINNIKIDQMEIPQNVHEFENYSIYAENTQIDSNVSNFKLTYGNGELLENNVFNNSNNKLKLITPESKETVKITYNFDEDNTQLQNLIEIVANGDTDVYIEYNSKTEQKCYHNGIIRVIANKNAKINVTIINLLNDNSDNFEAIENEINENSIVNFTIIDIGANKSISNYYSNIIGENAQNDLKTIYLGKENQIKDINYIGELRGKKSFIDIDVQGALKDSAKKNFKGTIDFKKGSKKSKGNENEYCMLLSDKAKSIALPMLLCTEEDVEGNHSTASGKVDEKELFYIMSRGIDYKDAVKLIVKSRFNKILERIKDEQLKEIVITEIDNRLD